MVTKFLQNLCCLPIRLIFRFFFGYQVKTGVDYKDLPKPLIIIANHDTWFDAFLAGVAFPVFSKIFPIRFAGKTELFENFLSKKFLSLLGAFPVKRKVGLEISLELPLKILRQGGVVLIFPEGTRKKPGEKPIKARRGTAYLALKTGAPILPIAIKNAVELRFKDFILRKRSEKRITILIGKPFSLPPELKYPDDLDKATEIINKVVIELRESQKPL